MPLPPARPAAPGFLYAVCQIGAERTLKGEMAQKWPAFHFAFSRPGFLTFKLPADAALRDDFDPGAVFARAHGFSLGKVRADDVGELARTAWQLAGDRRFEQLHVWQRDAAPPGFRRFEVGPTALAREAEQALRQAAAAAGHAFDPAPTRVGQFVLDCVLVEPHEWWVGFHRAGSTAACWPGGVPPVELPADAVSRAYLKMEEALLWSALPIAPGDRAVEIGCAPGGASQALLAHGLKVTGIDPAEVDPRVLAHPNFAHVKKRGADVRRREFRGLRWLMADMNVAPHYTLDTVESIVTYPTIDVRGLLLTLKLLDWKLAEELPANLARIENWGFDAANIRARQLAHNRHEVCVAAMKEDRRAAGSRRRRVSK